MWLLDPNSVPSQPVANFSDFWHTILVALAVWIGNKLHQLTGGGPQ